MPDFIFVHQFNGEAETSGEAYLRNLDEATAFARLQLEHGLVEREDTHPEQAATVAVGIAGEAGQVEWVGAWSWDEAAGFVWTAES